MLFATCMISLSLALPAPGPQTLKVQVDAGKFERINCPVFVTIEDPVIGEHYDVRCLETGALFQGQGLARQKQICWIIPSLESKTIRTYELSPRSSPAENSVICQLKDGHLQASCQGRNVLVYNISMNEAPKGMDPLYRRNGYIHPVWSPNGLQITDDFAPDHPHQHGIFLAWTKCRFAGHPINFWDQQAGGAVVIHKELSYKTSGPVIGQFEATHHLIDKTGKTPTTIAKDVWLVSALNTPEGFLFDIQTTETCLADSPLTIGPYHYGGMAIRGNRRWLNEKNPDRFSMLTSEGKRREAGNQTRPQWVDFSGKLDNKAAGLTIFCHPDNLRAPQPVRLHPSKPYFVFAPLALGEFQLKPGEPLVLSYRYFVYDGPISKERSQSHWHNYAQPPKVRIL